MSADLGPGADLAAVARHLGAVAVEAGALVAAAPDRTLGRLVKEDGSPTTSADAASEALILSRLRDAFPGVPVVAEETGAEGHEAGLFLLVDPLDGTRDYLDGRDEYSVNIALVRDGRPVAAAIAAPGRSRVWVAAGTTETADVAPGCTPVWREARVRPAPSPSGRVVLVSRRHADPAEEACLGKLASGVRRMAGSALKFGLIASGEADLYVRCGPTMEWDIAAGDLIVAAAGGVVVGPDGLPPTYGHASRGYRNGPFAVLGDPSLASQVRLPPSCPRR